MGSPGIAALRLEIAAQREELRLPLEGMRDYVRVGNGVEGEQIMRTAAAAAAGDYQRRLDLMYAVDTALTALETDGFPEIPDREVPPGVLEQLQRNHETIAAALARFTAPEPASDGTIRFGAGVFKAPRPSEASPPA